RVRVPPLLLFEIAEILAREHLRYKDDLPRVIREVFDNGVDHFEQRLIEVLDGSPFGEPAGRQIPDALQSPIDRRFQPRLKFAFIETPARGEFRVTIANIAVAHHTRENPLAD